MRSVTTSVSTDRPVICPRTSNLPTGRLREHGIRHVGHGLSTRLERIVSMGHQQRTGSPDGRPTDDVKRLVQRALDSLIERI